MKSIEDRIFRQIHVDDHNLLSCTYKHILHCSSYTGIGGVRVGLFDTDIHIYIYVYKCPAS